MPEIKSKDDLKEYILQVLQTIIMNPGDYIQAMPKDELYQTLEADIDTKFEQYQNNAQSSDKLLEQKVENVKLRMENMELQR